MKLISFTYYLRPTIIKPTTNNNEHPVFLILLEFNKHNSKSSALSFKNRFLTNKITTDQKLSSFFYYKGFSKYANLTFNKCYIQFLRLILGLHQEIPNHKETQALLINSPEFIRLFNANLSMRNLGRAYLLRAVPLAPKIKSICILKKLKKKKTKKKKLKKYTTEFRFITPPTRLQVLNRWSALLIRTFSKKLDDGFLKVFPPFIIKPANSRLFLVRQRVYNGLALK